MRSEGFFTYPRGAYTNFLHEERKMRRLLCTVRAVWRKILYDTCDLTSRRVKKCYLGHMYSNVLISQ